MFKSTYKRRTTVACVELVFYRKEEEMLIIYNNL